VVDDPFALPVAIVLSKQRDMAMDNWARMAIRVGELEQILAETRAALREALTERQDAA
jgi:hypothetical protein